MLTLFLLSSCEKAELPVPAHNPGSIITTSVFMESDYRNQLFFDLETNSLVKQNRKTDWDLGFETSATGRNVILNSAKLMFAANTQQSNFTSVNSSSGYTFNIDMPSGNLDSTAIGNWTANQVYVIDRGYDEVGTHQGFKKIEFVSVTTNEYVVHFANLDGSNEVTMHIPKDTTYNFTYLSLTGNIASVEPPKEHWDLSFSQYTHFYTSDETTYLVNGCLSNRTKVEIAPIFDKEFAAISFNDVANYPFSKTINTIGFEWKEYDFDTGSYIIYDHKNYIIKSTEGKYYKLHFIDFYDDFGVKGTPTFEFQEL
jgi:hypothetical protein